MKKLVAQKSYAGEFPRPSVETFTFENENLIIAGTPWGNQDALKQLSDTFRDFISASVGDQDATSPFAKLPGITPRENALRAAALLANETIFTKLNKEAYTSACEALVLHFHESELTWVQVGQPHLFLRRHGKLQPLHFSLDLSLDYENATPLPSRLFGIEKHWDIETRSLVLREGDQLLVLARSKIPAALFTPMQTYNSSLEFVDAVVEDAVSDDSTMPFWVGLIE